MGGFVYLICDGERFKIGVTTTTLKKRLRELQTGNPNELWISKSYKTLTPFRLEQLLHVKFKINKVKNEWFELNAHEVINFNKTCDKLQNIVDSLKDNPYIKNI